MKKKYIYITLGVIITSGLILRFWNLTDSGFKMCDEGYYFLYPYYFAEQPNIPSLSFKHGTMFWVYLGLNIFDFTYNGCLYWSAFCGFISIFWFYLFSRCFLSKSSSTLATSLFSTNYYLLFYHRSNLCESHTIFFFTLILFMHVLSCQLLNCFKNNTAPLSKRYLRFLVVIFTGCLLGFIFCIRIQALIIALGAIGALGLAMTIDKRPFRRHRKELSKYLLIVGIELISAIIFIFAFMNALGPSVNWEATWKMFSYELWESQGIASTWKPYLLIFIWNLCGTPFIVLSGIGLFRELFRFKHLNIYHKWLLICTIGLTAVYLKIALPWPRVYIYFVIFLTFYFCFGFKFIFSILPLKPKIKFFIATLLIASTLISEILLAFPLINKKNSFLETVKYLAKKDPGDLIGTHSWPLYSVLRSTKDCFMIYELTAKANNYQELCDLIYKFKSRGVKYIILDNNVSFYGKNNKVLKQFVLMNPPDVFFYNTFGEDYHVCMENFGRRPKHDIFSDKIMIYDISLYGKFRKNALLEERSETKTSDRGEEPLKLKSHKILPLIE